MDEVTQWEIVASVQRISEDYLVPIVETMLAEFPFVIRGFHSDNGSEFVNKTITALLNKMLIRFTKSRPRHFNDNDLVETKNGSVIRKQLGYTHIPQRDADLINEFNREFFIRISTSTTPASSRYPLLTPKARSGRLIPTRR